MQPMTGSLELRLSGQERLSSIWLPCFMATDSKKKSNSMPMGWTGLRWWRCALLLPSSSHLQRVDASLYKVRVLSRPAVHLQTNGKFVSAAFALGWPARRGGRGKPWSLDRSCRGRSPLCRRSARSLWRGELRMLQTPAIKKCCFFFMKFYLIWWRPKLCIYLLIYLFLVRFFFLLCSGRQRLSEYHLDDITDLQLVSQ